MTTFILDTLAYSETLKAGGFSEQQATTQARALAEILDRQMATKAEAIEHENALRRDIETLRNELKRDIRESELRLEAKVAETKAELTRWVVGAGILQTSLIIGVLLKVAKLI
jgi:L-rhamnose isomerase